MPLSLKRASFQPGKSTLVQLLFGLRKPLAGQVKIGTGKVGRHPHDTLAYASSEPFLLHASVRENLCYGNPDASPEAMVEAARLDMEGKDSGTIDAEVYPATARMAYKLADADGKARYAERKGMVEPANGWIKNVLNFRRFSLRGLQAVRGEWDLICLATNLRRMQPLIVMN